MEKSVFENRLKASIFACQNPVRSDLNPGNHGMSYLIKYLVLFSLLALSVGVFGQAARSPFSTFGIGEPYGNALINTQAMGGIGVSQPQFWFINNQNPALLVFNYYTVFQAGAILESRTVKGDTTNLKSVNGNLNYLVTALPIKPGKWTTSVGLMPFTTRNFRLEYFEVVPDTSPQDSIQIVEQGTGGLSQLYWSNGVRLHENWAVGLKASYMFGSLVNDYTNTLFTVPQPAQFTIAVKEQNYIRGFQLTGGLSFSRDSVGSRDDYTLSGGLTYAVGSDLKARKTTVFQRRFLSGDPVVSDTIYATRGRISIPAVLTVGFSFAKTAKWATGLELTLQDWTNFSGISQEESQDFDKSWRISAGGELTPDVLSDNLLKRITYRAGFIYEKSPFLINNNELRDFGINFGLSLPTGRSSLDLAFSTGKRGDKSKNVLEETYFKVYFGVTFNDQWFIRRKFD